MSAAHLMGIVGHRQADEASGLQENSNKEKSGSNTSYNIQYHKNCQTIIKVHILYKKNCQSFKTKDLHLVKTTWTWTVFISI